MASAAATAAPNGPNERVRIRRDDATADEPSYATLELRPDGAFTIEHIASNGGGSSTVRACTGRLPPAEATGWIARVRNGATLATPPRTPSFAEALAQHIEHRYEITYASSERTTYADPARWSREVDVLIEHVDKGATCKTFQRGG